MADFLHVRGSRNVEIQNHTLKKSVYHVRYAEKMWFFERQKGRKYYGCEDNPTCEFMSWQKPSKEKCPKCGSYMVEKGNKLLCSNEECGYKTDIKNDEKNE